MYKNLHPPEDLLPETILYKGKKSLEKIVLDFIT